MNSASQPPIATRIALLTEQATLGSGPTISASNDIAPPPIAPSIFTLPPQNVDQSHEGRIEEENDGEGAKEEIDTMDDILTAICLTDPTVSLFDLKLSRSELEEVAPFFNELDLIL
ncbi:uncharacterized protein MONOS_8128 [Monocercomonoides exilis]|uniref:uncharacterized protein n=1 Tax=Monocercomonoides exilis TaxID=2049356 RepID=UPI00355A0E15|nr:hypothetical protein MONOS_8128 [Monocercomonoides exilis]|eukprot:MONOS_8128.1-p1 / transcript=MONOS_8128.1 / gene=MONOS_8128 / organism=Monocercomonoides_exilis_PA203 / gene_product=unspecified product / transcript_product=unspecified product / location=Mono_scaffold00298:10-357(+) / protein_length=116 / sequence_SO=supercontig / SO=protein_coding / is_pseudo=false